MSRSDHTPVEWAAIRIEAQRRVRNGEVAAQVARALGVAIATFQHWQAEDGFRRKDLASQRLTGTRLPRPVWLVKNARRGETGRNSLPADYVHRVAMRESQLAMREAEVRAARSVDPALAGRTAMGEAMRLHEIGDAMGAERIARLAERFFRMQARLAGRMERPLSKKAPLEKALADPNSPESLTRDRVRADLDRLIARLEHEAAERQARASLRNA